MIALFNQTRSFVNELVRVFKVVRETNKEIKSFATAARSITPDFEQCKDCYAGQVKRSNT